MFAQRQSFTIEQEQAVYRDSQIDKLTGKQTNTNTDYHCDDISINTTFGWRGGCITQKN